MPTLHLHVSLLFAFRGHMHNTVVNVPFQSYANATEKQPCVFELSTYAEIDVSGTGFQNIVVRDNCETARFFCDTTTQVCERLRLVGQRCQYHRDCQSVQISILYFADLWTLRLGVQYNCLRNVCTSPPEEPFEVALWQYAVTTLAVVLGRYSSLVCEGLSRRFTRRSNGGYLHHVGDDAPPASFETLSRDLRVL
jgi:hypothetical protein